jgi:hypothetical protein
MNTNGTVKLVKRNGGTSTVIEDLGAVNSALSADDKVVMIYDRIAGTVGGYFLNSTGASNSFTTASIGFVPALSMVKYEFCERGVSANFPRMTETMLEGTAIIPELPDEFPVNMGFKSLLSEVDADNHYFDTLENAGRYAIHHSSCSMTELIKDAYSNEVIALAMNPASVDGENRSITVSASATGEVWPGYWLQMAGSLITDDLGTGDTHIHVADANLFAVDNWVMIYQLDSSSGNPAWFSLPDGVSSGQDTGDYATTFLPMFEYARVTSVNYAYNTVFVSRGQTGTSPNSYTGYQAAVAAMIPGWSDDDGVPTQFKANYSLTSPRHPGTGENAAEFWSRGAAAALNAGINDGNEADVQHCLVPGQADVNCDLVADGGYGDGVNLYCLGYQEYTKRFRAGVGPAKIIQFDCIKALNGYRGWKYVNGVQMETFMGSTHFSEAFDTLSQWVDNAEASPAFSYGYCREPTETYGDVAGADYLFRKHFAVGLMLGMPHPYGNSRGFGLFDWDEQRGGNLDDYTWLGHALGPFQRDLSALGTTDLIAGDSWQVVTDTGFSATSSGSLSDAGGLEINVTDVPPGERVYSGVRLEYAESQIQLQTYAPYTLVFEAKATDEVVYQGTTYGGMPGYIRIEEHGTIVDMGVLAGSEWRTYQLGYTTGANAMFRADIGFGEGKCSFWIKNIKLFEGSPDRLWRDFENGRVYLNESSEPWVVDLGANQYWRLKGDIRPDINDGSIVTGSITVTNQDAVFLLKHMPRFIDGFDYTVGQPLETESDDWNSVRGGSWIVVNDQTNEFDEVDLAVQPPTGTTLAAVDAGEFRLLPGQTLTLSVDYSFVGSGLYHGLAFNIADGWNFYAVVVHGDQKLFSLIKVESGVSTTLAQTSLESSQGSGVIVLKYDSESGAMQAALDIEGVLYNLSATNSALSVNPVGVYAAGAQAYRVKKFDAVAKAVDP